MGNRRAHVVSGCVGGLCFWHLCVEGEPPVMGLWTASSSFRELPGAPSSTQEAPAYPPPSRGSPVVHPIQSSWCMSNWRTRLSGGKAMRVLILLHSWDPSLSTRLGAMSRRVSWLRTDGRLRHPVPCAWSGAGTEFWLTREAAPRTSAEMSLVPDGSSFQCGSWWGGVAPVTAPRPGMALCGVGSEGGADRPAGPNLNANTTLLWWFVNLDSAGPPKSLGSCQRLVCQEKSLMTSAILCSKRRVILRLLFQGAIYAGHAGWWKGGDRLIWTQFKARTLVVKGGCHLSSDSRHPALESWLS